MFCVCHFTGVVADVDDDDKIGKTDLENVINRLTGSTKPDEHDGQDEQHDGQLSKIQQDEQHDGQLSKRQQDEQHDGQLSKTQQDEQHDGQLSKRQQDEQRLTKQEMDDLIFNVSANFTLDLVADWLMLRFCVALKFVNASVKLLVF